MKNAALTFLNTALMIGGLSGLVNAEDRALVIGIDAYPTLKRVQPVQQAVADARRFRNLLVEQWDFPTDSVKMLENEAATSGAIMSNLIDALVGETEPGDRVVFYFAGLGSQNVAPAGNDADSFEEVLLAYDVGSLLGKIPESAISDILDIISDRDVTVVIDASFDGENVGQSGTETTVRAAKILPGAQDTNQDRLSEAAFGTGASDRAVWNAAAPGQFAWETPAGGVFTAAMVAGLQDDAADANGNGTITNAELLGYVREYSRSWCATNPTCAASGRGLDPHFSGPIQAAAGQIWAPVAVDPEPQNSTSVVASDEPVTFQETLGFVTDLFTPSNDANLNISINADAPMRLGDVISFSVDAERAGTLVLFDINPDGELAQIFPSVLSVEGDTRIAGGQTLTIPNRLSKNGQPLQIRVSEPVGQGFLLGLFVEDDLPALQAVLPDNIGGDPIPNAGRYLYEIAQELLKLQADADGNRAIQWSATYLPYQITR